MPFVLDVLEAVPTLLRTFADGGCSGSKLDSALRKHGIEDKLKTVRRASPRCRSVGLSNRPLAD